MDTDDSATPPPNAGSAASVKESTDSQLDLLWRRQRQWSLLAGGIRKSLDRWRLSNLILLVVGALVGALAAQPWLTSGAAQGFAIAAAVALALASFIQANALAGDNTARWTMARAASEALKAECYRYLIRVQPYDDQGRAQILRSQMGLVQDRAASLLVDQQATKPDDRPLPTMKTIAEYVVDRAQHQATWHHDKSGEHARQARTLRIGQLAATVIGVVLSAIAAFVPSWGLSTWIAAATTIAGAFGAHLAAAQHQRIAVSYAATADQLEQLVAGFNPTAATATQQAEFVAAVERVLAAQNQGWTDLLRSPSHNEAGGAEKPDRV